MELPELEELGEEFLANNKNREKILRNRNRTIDSKSMAVLDRNSELTTSEVSFAGKLLQKIRMKLNTLIKSDNREDR